MALSQQQLADALMLPAVTIWRWENLKMAIRHPKVVRRALNDLERELMKDDQARQWRGHEAYFAQGRHLDGGAARRRAAVIDEQKAP